MKDKVTWHETAEELPPKNTDVLVCDEDGRLNVAMMDWQYLWIFNDDEEVSAWDYFLYWTELPEVPEVFKGGK